MIKTMKIMCEKNHLQDALGLAGRAVASRSTMPVLECVLLTAVEGVGLTICANDNEMFISTANIPADIEEPGSVALNAKLFTDIIRKMPGDYIEIETDEKLITLCKCGQAKLKISGTPAEEFPMIPQEELDNANHWYMISANTLRDMIKQTIFSVSIDPSKAILTGELFDIVGNELRVVSVDMFRISYRAQVFEGDVPDGRGVIPAKALAELSRAVSGDENDVIRFSFTDKRVIFETETFTMSVRLLVGDFMRYNQIFNNDFSTMVVINRARFLSSIERAMLIAAENRSLSVKLDLSDDNLIITSQSEKGQTHDEIPCETNGKDLTIHFNPRYLTEVLKVIDEESVSVRFNTQRSPCTIESVNEENATNYRYLIVPLRSPV